MMTDRTRQEIAPEIKAAAIADLVLLSPATVAAKYGLKAATVRQWKRRSADDVTALVTQKKERLTALLAEYLEANLNAGIAQAYVASDPEYIKRQPAGELAVLHGVLADKLIRVVEVIRPAADDQL